MGARRLGEFKLISASPPNENASFRQMHAVLAHKRTMWVVQIADLFRCTWTLLPGWIFFPFVPVETKTCRWKCGTMASLEPDSFDWWCWKRPTATGFTLSHDMWCFFGKEPQLAAASCQGRFKTKIHDFVADSSIAPSWGCMCAFKQLESGCFFLGFAKWVWAGECGVSGGPHTTKLPQSWDTEFDQLGVPAVLKK